MKTIKLPFYTYEKIELENVIVFFDREGKLVLLPTLFVLSSRANLVSYKVKTVEDDYGNLETRLIEGELSDATIDTYLPPIKVYLSHLQYLDQNKSRDAPSLLHGASHATSKFINHYINNILAPKTNNISTFSMHIAALTCFYGWMWHSGLCNRHNIKASTKSRKSVAGRTGGQDKINYITRNGRELLKREANKVSLRDFLILEMGWEVGLRAKENQGMLLNDFYVGIKKCSGLKSLIADMKGNKTKQSFQYHLGSKFTKGSKQRQIYFSRKLLERINRYINGERDTAIKQGIYIMEKREEKRLSRLHKGLETSNSPIEYQKHDTLFVNNDNTYAGQTISKGCATKVFKALLTKTIQLNQKLSYQDCRHTFATELYHSMKQKKGSVNAALLEVAIRLGHSLKNGLPQEVTTRYIRLHDAMTALEWDS